MSPFLNLLSLCRFEADEYRLLLAPEAARPSDAPETQAGGAEFSLPLRQEVGCLQRWLDLNA